MHSIVSALTRVSVSPLLGEIITEADFQIKDDLIQFSLFFKSETKAPFHCASKSRLSVNYISIFDKPKRSKQSKSF